MQKFAFNKWKLSRVNAYFKTEFTTPLDVVVTTTKGYRPQIFDKDFFQQKNTQTEKNM